MENKDLERQVAAVVAELFNEKEEAEIRKNTEAKLQEAATSISELTLALEDKNAEVADFEEKISESEARIQELESELEAAKTKLETAEAKIVETENTLETMRKDRAAEVRMAELEEAGVSRVDKDSQMNKVREMTDEDFASYKEELMSIREAVVNELKKAAEEADKIAQETTETKPVEKAKEEVVEETEESTEEETAEESVEEEETAPPAQITPGQAAMASLNFEYRPTKDVTEKYRKMGEAMAAKFVKKAE